MGDQEYGQTNVTDVNITNVTTGEPEVRESLEEIVSDIPCDPGVSRV